MKMGLFFFLAIIQIGTWVLAQNQPSCDSKVYCQGELLHTVQMARPFNDSKTFVDMKMKNTEKATLQNFEKFLNDTNNNPTQGDVRRFVEENFENGDEFESWTPSDYNENPSILKRIEDEEIRNFAGELVKIWPQLARKIKQDVLDSSEYYTILPVEHGFVIPGGRFREFYYWDSYWIIKGLLVCDMYDTAKGMLDNFLSIVDKYGFLPNGARIYYLNRSQPPLLNLMVSDYIKATGDTKWLQNNIQILDKELRFWLDNKVIEVEKNGDKYTLAHYDSESGSPRPESYYEDVKTTSFLTSEEDRKQLYADIKSGAESGWDFSSRWIVDKDGGLNANLSHIQTRRIIPVDLNSFLCKAFRKLSEFYMKLNDFENAIYWYNKTIIWQKNIEEVFWHSEDGIWYDYDRVLQQPRRYFFPSNFAPLWAEAYDPLHAEDFGRRAAEYFQNQNISEYQGGIPASTSLTGEQWDYPNAWPPLQSIVVMGLDRSGNCEAKKIAKEFATRWIHSNMIGYNETHEMFEKYDAEIPGRYGGGGEYVIQSGFGWTNGVVFEFIERFFATTEKKG